MCGVSDTPDITSVKSTELSLSDSGIDVKSDSDMQCCTIYVWQDGRVGSSRGEGDNLMSMMSCLNSITGLARSCPVMRNCLNTASSVLCHIFYCRQAQ